MEIERDTANLTIRISIGEIARIAAIGAIFVLAVIAVTLAGYYAGMSGIKVSPTAFYASLGLATVLSLLCIGFTFYEWFRGR